MPPRRKKAAGDQPAAARKRAKPAVRPAGRAGKTCSGCQATLPNSAKECDNCGKTFGAGPRQVQPPPRPIPPRPPSDDEAAEELRRLAREDFGADFVLDNVKLEGNDRPGTYNHVKRGLCTKTMMNCCAAYMIAFGFAYPHGRDLFMLRVVVVVVGGRPGVLLEEVRLGPVVVCLGRRRRSNWWRPTSNASARLHGRLGGLGRWEDP